MKDVNVIRLKRLRRSMRLTGAIVLLSVGVLLPVLLSTLVGIVTLVLGESSETIILGVLTISFTSAAIGSAIIVTILLGRRARTARLQSDFLANITHELRTPLSSIRMYAQTLQMGTLEADAEQTKKSLDTIIRETDWLEAMIDQVLTWRAAAKDREVMDRLDEPIVGAVENTAKRFRRMCFSNETDFHLELNSCAPAFHDRGALESIVLNLLTNAYKYTPQQKSIQLIVYDSESTREVVIEVKDNGYGIPPREVEKIFEPFYRIESPIRSNISGAGLGLAIVRHLVQSHSGKVEVESALGLGSTFVVRLPMSLKEEMVS